MIAPRYGWRPDKPDFRDYAYVRPPRNGSPLPEEIDLRPNCSPVEDQGQLGSCTAHAVIGAMEYTAKMHSKTRNFSRLFLYYLERVSEGTVDYDAGAEIRSGVKAAAKVGVPLERFCPYTVTRFAKTPPQAAYTNAERHRVTEYRRITGLQSLLACLASGHPVTIGFTVYESFEGDAVAHSGVMTMPTRNERTLGGHAVLAVGYHMAARVLIVRNSWGAHWGDHGYFYMPFGYADSRDLSDDFWTITAEML